MELASGVEIGNGMKLCHGCFEPVSRVKYKAGPTVLLGKVNRA